MDNLNFILTLHTSEPVEDHRTARAFTQRKTQNFNAPQYNSKKPFLCQYHSLLFFSGKEPLYPLN